MSDHTVRLANVHRTRVWSQKDFLGTVHIRMQHDGGDPFDFIQIQYNYDYTSNAHQEHLAENILKLIESVTQEDLGVDLLK